MGVHITVLNTGWVKADNRVLLSGGDKKTIDMLSLCPLKQNPVHGNILWQTLRDKGMGFENHD